MCLEEISEGTISAKKGISNHLLSLGEKVSNFSPKVLIRAVRTAFYVSKGWILGKNLEVYSSLIFSDTAQNFWDLMPRAFAGLSIIHFTRPKGVFGRNFCLKSALHIHGYQAIIGRLFWKKFFGRVVQSESKVSRSSSFRKKNCWNFYHFFFIFGLWAVTSQTSDKKIMTGLPKLPSTVSEFFEREKQSHQEKFFPPVSDFELRFFGLLIKKFGSLTKTALSVSRGGFWRKKLSD